MKKIKYITYIPEARGYKTGSNNGNYEEWIEFIIRDNKHLIKYCCSGDGDIYEYPSWEETTESHYYELMEECREQEERELELMSN